MGFLLLVNARIEVTGVGRVPQSVPGNNGITHKRLNMASVRR